jgi:hypothetical protein
MTRNAAIALKAPSAKKQAPPPSDGIDILVRITCADDSERNQVENDLASFADERGLKIETRIIKQKCPNSLPAAKPAAMTKEERKRADDEQVREEYRELVSEPPIHEDRNQAIPAKAATALKTPKSANRADTTPADIPEYFDDAEEWNGSLAELFGDNFDPEYSSVQMENVVKLTSKIQRGAREKAEEQSPKNVRLAA